MGYFIRNGFIAIVNFFISIFQWIFIALAVTSPIWIIPAVVIIVLVRKKKKKKADIIAESQTKEAPPE
jgi:hypothetical protein